MWTTFKKKNQNLSLCELSLNKKKNTQTYRNVNYL